jgi:hypothetical protein
MVKFRGFSVLRHYFLLPKEGKRGPNYFLVAHLIFLVPCSLFIQVPLKEQKLPGIKVGTGYIRLPGEQASRAGSGLYVFGRYTDIHFEYKHLQTCSKRKARLGVVVLGSKVKKGTTELLIKPIGSSTYGKIRKG